MAASVEIDKYSGFCAGVIRAISSAEQYLDGSNGRNLFSLGAIVHNEEELARLGQKGLVTIDDDDLSEMRSVDGETLLVRAHGEPPQTYEKARALGFEIIDCTCPVVLRLQESIREAYARLHSDGADGQLIIFGKIGHAEVLGLMGQINDDVVVIEDIAQLQQKIDDGTIHTDSRIEIFSQTTKSPAEYQDLCAKLRYSMKDAGDLSVHNTICSQVAMRHDRLTAFALSHDVVVFVAGKASSNGKVLFDLCKSLNIRTYHVGSVREIRSEWFRPEDRVGVCGATSTPAWLLQDVAGFISGL